MNQLKRIDFRIVLGAVLILGGILLLLDRIGLFPDWLKAGDLFWGSLTALAGLAFLYIMITDRRQWWAAFPAFTFLGISASAFLPASLEAWSGLAFMTGISLGFWIVYITDRSRWWAIIPAGVLLTLGIVAGLGAFYETGDSGGVFFIGLGITFLLVAILPPVGRTWAYIPAAVLLILGAVIGTPFASALDYVWIAALFVGGVALIWQFLRKK
jgi:hypothetical protein